MFPTSRNLDSGLKPSLGAQCCRARSVPRPLCLAAHRGWPHQLVAFKLTRKLVEFRRYVGRQQDRAACSNRTIAQELANPVHLRFEPDRSARVKLIRMVNNAGWTETEVRAAVGEYFALLRAEQEGRQSTKLLYTGGYRNGFLGDRPRLSKRNFRTSAQSYTQRLPYASGLKPRFKPATSPADGFGPHRPDSIPAIEPHEILFAKLRELRTRGPINVARKGSGRFGLAIEAALGIPQNSAKDADFHGHRAEGQERQHASDIVLSNALTFVEDFDKTAMFQRHSHHDKTGRRALYTSFNKWPDTLGFRLVDRTC